jgi:hypothetical protein
LCLTAGTVWSAELKIFFAGISFVEFLHTRAIGELAHEQSIKFVPSSCGVRRRCRQGLRFLRAKLSCHADHVLSPRIVRIIQGLAEDWHRLDERIDHLSDDIAALARQDAGASGNAFSKAATSPAG